MIVVDASVAAKWVFAEERAEQARALIRASLHAAQTVVAPPLLHGEVTNIIRQRMRREALTLAEAQERLAAFLAIPIAVEMPDALYRRALEVAEHHHLPATYDAQYVALAELLSCPLWTDDQRLLRALDNRHPLVLWIGDYGR